MSPEAWRYGLTFALFAWLVIVGLAGLLYLILGGTM